MTTDTPEPAEHAAVRYQPVPRSYRVLSWPAASAGQLAVLLGPANVNEVSEHVIQVRGSDGSWVTLLPGWAVAVSDDDGSRLIWSAYSLAAAYEPVPGGV